MKRVFQSSDPALIAVLRQQLDDAGIEHTVLNEAVSGVSGAVPALLAQPEVWVADADEAKAAALVEAFEEQMRRREIDRDRPEHG